MAWVSALIIGGTTLAAGAMSKDSGQPSAESRRLMVKQGELIDNNIKRSNELWDMNNRTYVPREWEFVNEAFSDRDSPRAAADRVSTDVRLAAKRSNEMQLRDARRLGIDPNSGAYKALDTSKQISEIGLEAAGREAARRSATDRNFQRKYTALALGRGLPSQAAALTSNAASMNSGLINANLGLDAARADFDARRGEAIGEGLGQIGSGIADWYRSQKKPQEMPKAA